MYMGAGCHPSRLALRTCQRRQVQCEEKSLLQRGCLQPDPQSRQEQLGTGMIISPEPKTLKSHPKGIGVCIFLFSFSGTIRRREHCFQGAEVTSSSMSSISNVLGTLCLISAFL